MYSILISLHSAFRWLVIIALLYAIYRAYRGYTSDSSFSKSDNAARHWTATIAQVQMLIGMTLYTQSPLIRYFWKDFKNTISNFDIVFYGLVHILIMLTAVVFLSAGSSLAKRRATDKEKFRTILVWFVMAFVLILMAIPWPFSPLAQRPYIR